MSPEERWLLQLMQLPTVPKEQRERARMVLAAWQSLEAGADVLLVAGLLVLHKKAKSVGNALVWLQRFQELGSLGLMFDKEQRRRPKSPDRIATIDVVLRKILSLQQSDLPISTRALAEKVGCPSMVVQGACTSSGIRLSSKDSPWPTLAEKTVVAGWCAYPPDSPLFLFRTFERGDIPLREHVTMDMLCARMKRYDAGWRGSALLVELLSLWLLSDWTCPAPPGFPKKLVRTPPYQKRVAWMYSFASGIRMDSGEDKLDVLGGKSYSGLSGLERTMRVTWNNNAASRDLNLRIWCDRVAADLTEQDETGLRALCDNLRKWLVIRAQLLCPTKSGPPEALANDVLALQGACDRLGLIVNRAGSMERVD